MIGITDLVSYAEVCDARQFVAKAAVDLHRDRVSDCELQTWLDNPTAIDADKYRRGANHVWGNCGFGFIFGQLNSLEETLYHKDLEYKPIPFEYQPMHRYNLEWIEKQGDLCDTIFELGRANDAVANTPAALASMMISFDSTKFLVKAKSGTTRELTKHHADIYSDDNPTRRRQMAIEMSTRAVGGRARRLVYVPFTQRDDVRALIAEALGKPNVFDKNGFVGLHSDPHLCDVFDRHAIGFDSYHLAMWGDGVVHFEAMCVPVAEHGGLARVLDRTLRSELLECIRMIMGTHYSTQAHTERMQLAVLCEAGYMPSLYRSNLYKKTETLENMMCLKSTQYKKPRSVTTRERVLFSAAKTIATDTVERSNFIQKLPEKIQKMYGVTPRPVGGYK